MKNQVNKQTKVKHKHFVQLFNVHQRQMLGFFSVCVRTCIRRKWIAMEQEVRRSKQMNAKADIAQLSSHRKSSFGILSHLWLSDMDLKL